MKYEARIQGEIADLSDVFFENIIVYELIRPSGLGGPGCIIMFGCFEFLFGMASGNSFADKIYWKRWPVTL